MALTKSQLKYLRTLAHDLKPVIWLGQNGLTGNVLAEIDAALDHHELIKIKIRTGNRKLNDKVISDICQQMEAEYIQKVGNIASIYRRNPDQPVFSLPR